MEKEEHFYQDINPTLAEVRKFQSRIQKEFSLSPKTIKPVDNLNQALSRTAFCWLFPKISPEISYLTEAELQLKEQITTVPKITVVDIDGPIIDNFWPAFKSFCQNPLKLRQCFENHRPSWTSLLPLGELARVSDHLFLWTSRFSPSEQNLLWQRLQTTFGNLGSFDAFPFLSQAKIKKITNTLPRTEVISGKIKIFDRDGIKTVLQEICKQNDPYVVIIGSSRLDFNRFQKILRTLRKQERPFDRVVFCTNGHLLL